MSTNKNTPNEFSVKGVIRDLAGTAKYLQRYGSRAGVCPVHNTKALYDYTDGSIEITCNQCTKSGAPLIINAPIEAKADKKNYTREAIEVCEKMYAKPNNNPKKDQVCIIRDGDRKIPVIYTGRSSGNTYEVKVATDDDLECHIYSYLFDRNFSTDNAKKVREHFLMYGRNFFPGSVKQLMEGSEEVSLTRMLIPNIEPANTYHKLNWWSKSLDRISDKEAFGAWFWTILEPKWTGRQGLFMYAPNGNEGKSLICKVLGKILPKGTYFSVKGNSFGSGSRFDIGNLEELLLLGCPDFNNPNIFKTDKLKQILGKDNMFVEQKGLQGVNVRANAGFIGFSNQPIQVDGEEWERSRILWLDIDPYTPDEDGKTPFYSDLEGKMLSEKDDFLSWCKWCYQQKVEDDNVIISDISVANINEAAEEVYDDTLSDLSRVFDFSDEYHMERRELKEGLRAIKHKTDAQSLANVKRFLKEKMGVQHKKIINEDGIRKNCYIGIRKNNVWG